MYLQCMRSYKITFIYTKMCIYKNSQFAVASVSLVPYCFLLQKAKKDFYIKS